MENEKNRALVLEGGAMRGLFTAGILDVFMENGIAFDFASGVSAGAVFGCNFKSGQIGRTIRYNLRFCNDWRYCSLRSLIKTGDLYGADFCYRELPEVLDPFDYEAFKRNPMVFDIAVTNIDTGKPEYWRASDGRDTDMLWMRASASMPFVSKPVKINGQRYLDGGIADPIPYLYTKKKGYRKCVVILTQPRDYKKTGSGRLFSILLHGRNRKTAEMMEKRSSLYNRTRDEIFRDEKVGSVFVICPDSSLDIKRTEKDRKKLQECYNKGRRKGEEILPDLIKYLNS